MLKNAGSAVFVVAAAVLAFGSSGGSRANVPISNPAQQLKSGVSIIYFGTRDCPTCRWFKKEQLAELKAWAKSRDIKFHFREIDHLYSLGDEGAFGQFDTAWKATVEATDQYAVPSFAYVRDGIVVDANTGDWTAVAKRIAVAR